jgi:hypothetical protein
VAVASIWPGDSGPEGTRLEVDGTGVLPRERRPLGEVLACMTRAATFSPPARYCASGVPEPEGAPWPGRPALPCRLAQEHLRHRLDTALGRMAAGIGHAVHEGAEGRSTPAADRPATAMTPPTWLAARGRQRPGVLSPPRGPRRPARPLRRSCAADERHKIAHFMCWNDVPDMSSTRANAAGQRPA